MNLFEYIYPRFYFSKDKTVKLFEAFSGVGCQAMALKRITDNYELVGFSEIDKYAIQSYRAIHGEVKNYGDITKMLTIPKCDIFTYSFPCQDLSLAGNQKGLGEGTRSGLVYEVLRLLKNTEIKPKVLIMENVSALISATFVKQFNEIQLELEQLGYKNYNEILNAKDYGIPQNRERIFMVSILGDYSYTFPEPINLELRLKDLLENEVDEKYYLSEKMIKQISSWNAQVKPLKEAKTKDDIIIQTITAKSNTSMNSSMLLIKEATVKGYAEATDGDGVYINRPHQKRGVVQKGMIQTIKTSGNDIAVVVEDKPYSDYSLEKIRGNIVKENVVGTITANAMQSVNHDNCHLVIEQKSHGYNKDGKHICPTIKTSSWEENNHLVNNLRIRKLTPLEAFRLMGISDDDFWKAQESGMSNAQLYKQAGNGIVVNVFEAILRNLFKE